MGLLTFVIPTRKRHRELSVCVRSIAEQIGEQDVRILILFNNEDTDTVRVVARLHEKWPYVSAAGCDGEPDYDVKFRSMFRAAPDSEWVWTFGDDDVLEPNALKFMLDILSKAPPELAFIHVSERSRSTGSGDVYKGRMIDLCCQLGWIEFTGFISANITRGKLLAQCAETPNWNVYARTAFVHSCALLEVLRKEQTQFIDMPLIDVQPDRDESVTKQKVAQWRESNVEIRYLYLADSLQLMYDQEIIKSRLPVKFFRYHHYHLWDRHITCFLLIWLNENKIWYDDWAFYAKRMAGFVDDDVIRDKICEEIIASQRWVLMMAALGENLKTVREDIMGVLEKRASEQYKFTYVS